MHRVIGRSLIATAAMSLCFITASYALPAAEAGAKTGKPLVLVNAAKSKHLARKSARLHHNDRKLAKASGKTVGKTTAKATTKSVPVANNETPDDQVNPVATSSALPPEVANAHAELTAGDAQGTDQGTESPSTLTEADKTAGTETAGNGVQVAAADQLNDIDRDMTAQTPASTAPVKTAMLADKQITAVQHLFSQSHSLSGEGWSGASLIGKIFIGFGAMLTLASAARMLIA